MIKTISIFHSKGWGKMELKIGVIKGDGIGPEIVDEALKVLDRVGKVYGHTFSYTQLLMGGASIDVNGVPLTEETLNLAKESGLKRAIDLYDVRSKNK